MKEGNNMNELTVINNTYSLAKWIGQEENIKINTSHIILDEDSFAFIKNGESVYEQDEPINVIDVKFKASTILKA